MLSKDLEVTLNEAFRTAKSKRHEFMTVEHLLLSLLDNAVALDVLDHEHGPAPVHDVEQPHHVRMIEASHRLGLPQEALFERGILGQAAAQ